jgi:predicted DNA-binding transcriptional regulator AlpA
VTSKDGIECRLLTSAQMRREMGSWSTMTEWRYLNDERYAHLKFPKPIKIGRRNYWVAREIVAWVEMQVTAGRDVKPAGAPEAA